MAIIRINEFHATAAHVVELRSQCEHIAVLVRACAGCLSCELLQSQSDPAHLLFIERWERKQDHDEAIKQIPRELIDAVRPLLAAPPKGEYFDQLD